MDTKLSHQQTPIDYPGRRISSCQKSGIPQGSILAPLLF